MTEVTAKFNPFSTCAKPARLFLTFLPPNVRANGTVVHTALLPRDSADSSSLKVKFSTLTLGTKEEEKSVVVIEKMLIRLRRGWQGNGLQLLKNQHQGFSRGGRPSFAPITKGRRFVRIKTWKILSLFYALTALRGAGNTAWMRPSLDIIRYMLS